MIVELIWSTDSIPGAFATIRKEARPRLLVYNAGYLEGPTCRPSRSARIHPG